MEIEIRTQEESELRKVQQREEWYFLSDGKQLEWMEMAVAEFGSALAALNLEEMGGM